MICCGISGAQAKLFLIEHGVLDNPGLGNDARAGTTPNVRRPAQTPYTAAQTSTSASLGKRCLGLLKKIGIASLECFLCLLTGDVDALRRINAEPASVPNARPNPLQNQAAQYVGTLPPQSVVQYQGPNPFQVPNPYQGEISLVPSVGFNPTQSQIRPVPSVGFNPGY